MYEPELQLITFQKIAYRTIVEVNPINIYQKGILIMCAYQHCFLSAN